MRARAMRTPASLAEQARARSPEFTAFFETLAGFAVLALVMLGVGATIYKLVAPNGWLAQLFGHGLAGSIAAAIALLAVGAFAWFTREWATPRRRNRFADLWVYTCAGAGLLYLAQLWLKGTL